MDLGEVISRRRRALGLSQADLADGLNAKGASVSNQAVSKWETGATLPNARQFLQLCEVLKIDDIRGEFLGEGDGLLAGLNREGRVKAREFIQLLRDSGRFAPVKSAPVVLRSLPLYALAVSAGTGQFLDGEDYELVEVDESVPGEANYGVRVAGDSMEPLFHDGEIVWVRQQRDLMTGQIGIFLYDGCAYLKELAAVDGQLALHSLNPAYRDIPVSPELPLRVLGRVLR